MATKGVHVNVYKLPGTNTWRCDLKLTSTETGEGVTLRGVADEEEEDDDEEPIEKVKRIVRKHRKRRRFARAMRGEDVDDDDDDDDEDEPTATETPKERKRKRSLWRAISKSVALAKHMLQNPGVAAALPGGAAAVRALDLLNKAQKRGTLKKIKDKFRHPDLKKLARELHEAAAGSRSAMSGGGVCLCDERATRAPQRQLGAGRGREFNFMGVNSGHRHPFAEMIAQQMDDAIDTDPIVLKRLAAMQAAQRRLARQAR